MCFNLDLRLFNRLKSKYKKLKLHYNHKILRKLFRTVIYKKINLEISNT